MQAIAKSLNGVLKGIHDKSGAEIMSFYAPGARNVYFNTPVPDQSSKEATGAFNQQVTNMFSAFANIDALADDDLNLTIVGNTAHASLTGHNETLNSAGKTGYNPWKWNVDLVKSGSAWKIANDQMAFYNDPNAPEDSKVADACSNSASTSLPRFTMQVLSLFSLAAIGLTAVGLFGVMMYLVAQRDREFGLRLALGATNRQIAGLVLRDAIITTCCGLAIGTILVVISAKSFSGFLFRI